MIDFYGRISMTVIKLLNGEAVSLYVIEHVLLKSTTVSASKRPGCQLTLPVDSNCDSLLALCLLSSHQLQLRRLTYCNEVLAKEQPNNQDHVERRGSNIPIGQDSISPIDSHCLPLRQLSFLSFTAISTLEDTPAETVPGSSVVCSTYPHIILFQNAL